MRNSATAENLALPAPRRFARRTWAVNVGRFPLAAAGAAFLVAIVVAAIFASSLLPKDPTLQNLGGRLTPPLGVASNGERYLLGSDQLGRDVLTRAVYGARVSLQIGFFGVLATALIGVPLGLIAGFVGGAADRVIAILINLQLSFPFVLLAIVMVSLIGVSKRNIIIVFAITSWPLYARTVRAQIMSLSEREFVSAARVSGATNLRILLRHLSPHVSGPLIVIGSFEVARLIILEAALGFLGLSIKAPTPTWGNMLADGRQYVADAWWIAAVPGIAITLTSASVNFIGDALRDALDPTSAQS